MASQESGLVEAAEDDLARQPPIIRLEIQVYWKI